MGYRRFAGPEMCVTEYDDNAVFKAPGDALGLRSALGVVVDMGALGQGSGESGLDASAASLDPPDVDLQGLCHRGG